MLFMFTDQLDKALTQLTQTEVSKTSHGKHVHLPVPLLKWGAL